MLWYVLVYTGICRLKAILSKYSNLACILKTYRSIQLFTHCHFIVKHKTKDWNRGNWAFWALCWKLIHRAFWEIWSQNILVFSTYVQRLLLVLFSEYTSYTAHVSAYALICSLYIVKNTIDIEKQLNGGRNLKSAGPVRQKSSIIKAREFLARFFCHRSPLHGAKISRLYNDF
jgi:hypothetical protein